MCKLPTESNSNIYHRPKRAKSKLVSVTTENHSLVEPLFNNNEKKKYETACVELCFCSDTFEQWTNNLSLPAGKSRSAVFNCETDT